MEVSFPDAECAGDIAGLLAVVQPCLRIRSPGPKQNVGPQFRTDFCGYSGGDDFCLVVASFPLPCPVQGDRDDSVDISEMSRKGNESAQHPAIEPPRRPVSPILHFLRDSLVSGLRHIVEQCRCPCSAHPFRKWAAILEFFDHVSLNQCIKPVGHRVGVPVPEVSQRQIRLAEDTEMPFSLQKPSSAYCAFPWNEKVAHSPRSSFQFLNHHSLFPQRNNVSRSYD